MDENNPWYDSATAPDYIRARGGNATTASLAKHRHYGTGPKFFLFGRNPRYRQSDLDAWVAEKMSTRPYSRTREYTAPGGESDAEAA